MQKEAQGGIVFENDFHVCKDVVNSSYELVSLATKRFKFFRTASVMSSWLLAIRVSPEDDGLTVHERA